MTSRSALLTAVLASSLGLAACESTSQDTAPEAATDGATDGATEAAPMDPEQMMAAYTEANATNENHARMAQFGGEWDVAGLSWMVPGEPPMESTGTARYWMILGGRYMRHDYSSAFMGTPYSGFGISGYDNGRQTYVDYWFDNMGTAAYVAEGNWNDAGTVYTAVAEHRDPVTGATERMKHVIAKDSADEFVFTMYSVPPNGEAVKSMELTYTRKK